MLSLFWDSCISLSSALFVFSLVSCVCDDCSGAYCIVLSFKPCFSTLCYFTCDALFSELSFSSKLSISSCVSDKTFDFFIGFCIGEERFLLLGGVRNIIFTIRGYIFGIFSNFNCVITLHLAACSCVTQFNVCFHTFGSIYIFAKQHNYFLLILIHPWSPILVSRPWIH